MDPIFSFTGYITIILIVSIIGALLPQLIKLSDKQVHLAIAFSAGIFLGVLFLMLLPEAINESIENNYSAMTVMYAVLGGFIAIFIVDFLLKQYYTPECTCKECLDHHSHDITSFSAFIGLAIHACFDGLALATAFIAGQEIGLAVLVAMCIHKVVVVFSLSSTFLLSNKKKSAIKYLIAFCFISPIAGLFSYLALNGASAEWAGLAFAVSAGIFMFVTMCDIIPEAFHRKNLNIKSILLTLLGLVVVIAVVIITNALGGDIC
ncbi:MAG: ZIP family metal transporter [Candidatus Methanomethylophilaceae archaeon]|nr:ZIP family metal transporter [Candidatus Methanomethylophilaceae archaeon]MDD3378531.1 ZIP family metal transporter [Candidatus Methanomethylophilaceae archaeon]MDY0224546.1 ZIP family metal transporter [Candidatus Methanomethylophilaceae archaeon]